MPSLRRDRPAARLGEDRARPGGAPAELDLVLPVENLILADDRAGGFLAAMASRAGAAGNTEMSALGGRCA